MTIEISSDAVEDILVRLPVESLLRFRRVSKSFRCLIQNPAFVDKHHRRSSGYDHALIILPRSMPRFQTRDIFLVDSPDHNLVRWSNVARQISLSLLENATEDIKIVGHCSGLICILTWRHGQYLQFSLLNLALRQHKTLPVSRNLPSTSQTCHQCFGFGQDLKSGDYKIVRLAPQIRQPVIRAEIYSLHTNSWRPVVPTPTLLPLMQEYYTDAWESACLGGFCYWLGRDTENYTVRRIFAFDFSQETLHVMYLPEQMSQLLSARTYQGSWSNRYGTKVMVWNESIAVFAFPYPDQETRCFDVWLLDDPNSQKFDLDDKLLSVKNFFSIRVDESFNMFQGVKLIWNDEILLDCVLLNCASKLGVTDRITTLKTMKPEYVFLENTDEDERCASRFEIVGFVESLVSLN